MTPHGPGTGELLPRERLGAVRVPRAGRAGVILAAVVVVAVAGCGAGGGGSAAEGVARTFLQAQGPEVCGFLSNHELAAFADSGVSGLAGCRQAKQLAQGDVVADSVEARKDVDVAFVDEQGATALVEALDPQGRSVELGLVRESGEWRVDAVPDEIAGDPTLVGVRFAPTEGALFDALLFGPSEGDEAALLTATTLARRYVAMVEREQRLGAEGRRRKLAWAVRLTDDGSCDPCRAILRAGARRLDG